MIKDKNRAVISLAALRHNYQTLRQYTAAHTLKGAKVPEVIGVVKANAYGHGAEIVTKVLGDAGCRFFAVSSEREAAEVREWENARGRTPEILILGYTMPENVPAMAEQRILCTAVSTEHALAMAEAADKAGCTPLRIHVKLDTGMNRVGFAAQEDLAEKTAAEIAALAMDPRLKLCGMFTHFSCCDDERMAGVYPCSGEKLTEKQWHRFCRMRELLTERGVEPGFCHVANSAGLFTYPETYMDGVRAGIVLYGVSPDGHLREELNLRPVMRLETTVGQIHTLLPGEHVSYGATFTAETPMTLATLTIGYGDGFLRSYRQSCAVIGGRKYPITGRICMDQCMVDITGSETLVHAGDTAVLFGGDRGEMLLALAEYAQTIPYECLCAIAPRVIRTEEDL